MFRYDLAQLTDVAAGAAAGRAAGGRIDFAAAPNPFSTGTRLSFTLSAPGPVSLSIHDVRGRRVRELLARSLPAGDREIAWDGRTDGGGLAASGTY